MGIDAAFMRMAERLDSLERAAERRSVYEIPPGADILRLRYVQGADVWNNQALTGGVYTDVISDQNFTVGNISSLIVMNVSGQMQVGGANGLNTIHFFVDGSARYLSGGETSISSSFSNPFSGCGLTWFPPGSFVAGVHTVRIQIYCQANTNAFLRPTASPQYYDFRFSVLEIPQ